MELIVTADDFGYVKHPFTLRLATRQFEMMQFYTALRMEFLQERVSL